MINILVVDDDQNVRDLLALVLGDAPDIVFAGEASNGEEALEKIKENNYDVVLLDISMPGQSGFDVLDELKIMKPDIKVLMFSAHSEPKYVAQSFKLGATGYLKKEKIWDEFIKAIRSVSLGHKYIGTSLIDKFYFDISKGFK